MNRVPTVVWVLAAVLLVAWLIYRKAARRGPPPDEPGQNSEVTPEMSLARELVERGETVKAEELMRAAVHKAEQQWGAGSPQHAAAQNELGTVLYNCGQIGPAVEAYRAACAGPQPEDRQALRDRLTFQLNLAAALEAAGKLDEAEEVLRRSLAGRAEFYGEEHPGYAFALEPLADLLLHKGKTKEAVELAERAVAVFHESRHPRIATALVSRAAAYRAAGIAKPPFEGLDWLPDDVIPQIAREAVDCLDRPDPRRMRDVLPQVHALVCRRLGQDHQLALNLLAAIANLERELGAEGDTNRRIDAARQTIASYDRQNRPQEALQAVLGLALAQSDASQREEAIASYRDALARARSLGQPALVAKVRRNYGLLLADLQRRDEAQLELDSAVADARESSDREMLGRSQIALAIFLQHGGQLDDARKCLEAGIPLLDAASADAICGRSHLEAIVNHKSCGCGDTGAALAAAFREFVLARLPASTPLEKLEVTREGNDFKVQLRLKGKPNPEELEQLNRIIFHAQHEFRKRVLAKG